MQFYNHDLLYAVLSISVIIFAFTAVFAAKNAIAKGLTYAAMNSVIWALTIIAIANLWQTFSELMGFKEKFGNMPELVDYILHILAYSVFIVLVHRTRQIKG